MGIASPVAQPFGDPVPNGRAADIVRGVQRMLADMGLASLTEVTLANGRRADVMAMGPKGEVVIVEVKSCLQDYATDQKWPEYAPFCDRFLFAVDCDFPQDHIPEDAGLIVADAFGGAVIREAEARPLNAARRKAVTLGFARLAASRLMRSREGAVGADPADPSID
ncbi:MAG: MmcB family DNA repair protein [Alphaproteobacteria bacterium]|nr:MmcB family DNA repair protein [Alphaproteobacteria bacterium]